MSLQTRIAKQHEQQQPPKDWPEWRKRQWLAANGRRWVAVKDTTARLAA